MRDGQKYSETIEEVERAIAVAKNKVFQVRSQKNIDAYRDLTRDAIEIERAQEELLDRVIAEAEDVERMCRPLRRDSRDALKELRQGLDSFNR